MPSSFRFYRTHSAHRQRWLCYCCNLPMGGTGSPYSGLLSIAGEQLYSTAEHLHARKDGGANSLTNIVAAHAICNKRRHRRGAPLEPQAFRDLVQRRVSERQWFDEPRLQLLKSALETT